jgi:hypothetical protein
MATWRDEAGSLFYLILQFNLTPRPNKASGPKDLHNWTVTVAGSTEHEPNYAAEPCYDNAIQHLQFGACSHSEWMINPHDETAEHKVDGDIEAPKQERGVEPTPLKRRRNELSNLSQTAMLMLTSTSYKPNSIAW